MIRAMRFVFLLLLVFATAACFATSETAQITPAPPAHPPATPSAFDINAAVEAYLAKMPPARRASSNAYFEGGYWLILWDFLTTAAVMWLFLRFRWSAKMRNLAERITRFRPLQTALYWIPFIVVVSVITFS